MIQVEEPLSNEDVLKLKCIVEYVFTRINITRYQPCTDSDDERAGRIRQDGLLERILEEGAKAIHDADHMEIYRGATNILKYPELGNPDTATELLDTLVEKKALDETG